MEMLHHILLGIFKYVRNIFFSQIGDMSQTAQEINALAKLLGKFFARQSDRDLPKTNFTKGIKEGKIMAKEFSGVMLLIAAILQTTGGREMLRTKRGQQFKLSEKIDDWSLLVETLLEWEDFLKLPKMKIKHVKRLREKHKFLMFLLKTVADRTDGAGWSIPKFHGILHLVDDILNFGVPMNVDTGANESHHKLTKLCAKLTQRDVSVFESQTTERLVEFLLLELAMAELDGKTLWQYFVLDQDRGAPHNEQCATDVPSVVTTGAEMEVDHDEDEQQITMKYANSKQHDSWSTRVKTYLYELKQKVETKGLQGLKIRTEHKRHGHIFRAHPNYRQKGPWNDWALFNFGNTAWGPALIWCFLDFSMAPDNFSLQFRGSSVKKGVYAVVESTVYEDRMPQKKTEKPKNSNRRPQKKQKKEVNPESKGSPLFKPIVMHTMSNEEGGDGMPLLSLVDVELIVSPCCVIPDLGSQNIFRYLLLTPRSEWSKLFIKWMKQPHKYDKEEMEDDE